MSSELKAPPIDTYRPRSPFLDELFEAAVDATAEAVINALCMAHTTAGRGGSRAFALPLDRLSEIMVRFGRPALAVPPEGTI